MHTSNKVNNQTVGNCNPNGSLESITRCAQVEPLLKIRALCYLLLGCSTNKLAEYLGISDRHFLYVVKGKRESEQLKSRISETLGVSQDAIFGDSSSLVDFNEPPAAA